MREAVLLARAFFRDKKRLKTLIQYWTSKPDIKTLGVKGVLNVLLYEPVRLIVTLDHVRFFDHKLFEIPLRLLCRRELTHIHALLVRHHREPQPIFSTNLNVATFSLTYQSFKYNALMDQFIDRLCLVRLFLEACLAIFHLPHQHAQLKHALLTTLREERARMIKEKHPLRRRMAIFISNFARPETWHHEGN